MLLQRVIHVRLLKDCSKMNIVFTGGFFYPCGMAGTKRIQHYVDYLISRNVSVSIALVVNSSSNIKKFGYSGEFKSLKYRFFLNSDSNYLSRIFKYPIALFYFIIYLVKIKDRKSRNILFIYNGLNIEDFLLILFAKLVGYKIITDIVEDYSLHQEKISYRMRFKLMTNNFLEKRISYLSHGIVVLSDYLQQKFFRIVSDKVPIINIPISASSNNKDRNRDSGNQIILCYSGSFGYKDGLYSLIEAFKIVNNKHKNTVLKLSGTGNDPDKYLAMAGSSNVNYVGYLSDEDYLSFIKSADILCMTRTGSKYANAGFPFKLGEYLATGNPVIATEVSDLRKYLVNKIDAMLVQPDNIDEIANAMTFLIENKEEAIKIGQNGKNKWRDYFNAETNGRILYEWLLEI